MKIAMLLAGLIVASSAFADQYVSGYMRSDGTYVQPHRQTSPDRNPYNNYSTQGNMNPYTGQAGTRDPIQVQQQYAPQNFGSAYQPQHQPRQRSGW